MKVVRVDPASLVLGSVLRRALPCLLEMRDLRYDSERVARMNDLVFGEIVQVPPAGSPKLEHNFLERIYPEGDGVRLRFDGFSRAPFIGVIGNRYAPPYLLGGLTHPITGRPNGEPRGGALVDSLFGVNAIGYVNHEALPENRVRLRLDGVLADGRGRSLNLSSFADRLPSPAAADEPMTPVVLVAGGSSGAGKTTCARALIGELRARGHLVTMEKKTGTAACGDLLRCYRDPLDGDLDSAGDEAVIVPDLFPARDFVDAAGVASDVSIAPESLARESVRYTRAFLAASRPDFHVIELADNISHRSNVALLRSRYLRRRIGAIVYAPAPTYEAVAHFFAWLRSLGYDGARVVLSGPLANEDRHEMARVEVRDRIQAPLVRSAVLAAGRWSPDGRELATEVLNVAASQLDPL